MCVWCEGTTMSGTRTWVLAFGPRATGSRRRRVVACPLTPRLMGEITDDGGDVAVARRHHTAAGCSSSSGLQRICLAGWRHT